MMKSCFCCGALKDLSVKTLYPYKEDAITTERLVPQLLVVECDNRIALLCHQCFHKMDIDMWINREHWESFKPVVPFVKLPKSFFSYNQDKWNPLKYSPL